MRRGAGALVALALALAFVATGCVRPAESGSPSVAPSGATATADASPSPTMGHTLAGEPGALVATITVPRLGLADYPMHMGTTDELLLLGVGVYENAATPGNGNLATAGHRVTPVLGERHGPYYDIDLLGRGDHAWIDYAGWRWVYRWVGTVITTPDDTSVLADGVADLTMTACHPKYSKRQRIVAFWDLVRGLPLWLVPSPTPSPTPSTSPPASPTPALSPEAATATQSPTSSPSAVTSP